MPEPRNSPDRPARDGGTGLSLKWRKRLAILLLLVGLPVYVVVAMNIMVLFDRPHPLLELLIYLVLGIAWALPFRSLFRGVAAKPAGEDEAPRS